MFLIESMSLSCRADESARCAPFYMVVGMFFFFFESKDGELLFSALHL